MNMNTIVHIQQALRGITPSDRQVVASWLEGYQEREADLIGVPDLRMAELRVTEPGVPECAAGEPGASAFRVIGVREPEVVYSVELPHMSLDEYFDFEERSTTRHEYVNGFVQTMSGGSVAHCRIVQSLVFALNERLRGNRCEIFSTQVELNLKIDTDQVVYYPDVMVSCDKMGWGEAWIQNPRLVVEVLSACTRDIDRREKAMTYRRASTVEEYVIAAQCSRQLMIYRRAQNWVPEVVSGVTGMAEFRSLGVSIPLAEIYRNVFPEPT
jgi:Uma2 family endonuclease